MLYAIKHLTRFSYHAPVRESIMELRMRPATADGQTCLQFEVDLQPRALVFAYRDCLGNWVHHFDLPRRHGQLVVTARAQVQVEMRPPLPGALPDDTWDVVDGWAARGDHWDFRFPSRFAVWSDPLLDFARSLGPRADRSGDPLTTVRTVMAATHRAFDYAPNSTRVDSPIDEALANRRGVCQDFSHIMLALLRRVGLPCRYVSGYIAPAPEPGDPAGSADQAPAATPAADPTTVATHAWVEVLLPELGWVGADPTHDIDAGVRHIRVAIGRDYADVPPTRGIYKGGGASTLTVAVEIAPSAAMPLADASEAEAATAEVETTAEAEADRRRQEQQQQQQQQ